MAEVAADTAVAVAEDTAAAEVVVGIASEAEVVTGAVEDAMGEVEGIPEAAEDTQGVEEGILEAEAAASAAAAAADVIATSSFFVASIRPSSSKWACGRALAAQSDFEREGLAPAAHSSFIKQFVSGRRCCVTFSAGSQRAAHPGPKRFRPRSNASIGFGNMFDNHMIILFRIVRI